MFNLRLSPKLHLSVTLFSAIFAAGGAQAAIDVSQVPLETGTSVDPNILFIIDDSGSMLQGMMPEDLEDNGSISSGCSTSTYAGMSMCLYNTSGRAYLASNHLNKIYYDPTIEYPIPVNASGGLFATPSYLSARIDGYDSSSTTVNLLTSYRAIMSAGPVGTGAKANFAISPNGNAGEAFWYEYISGCSSSQYSDTCYTKKSPVTVAEKQNFANWYSFYRTRLLSAKAGIGAAFHQQGTAMRVGYGSINKMGNMNDVSKFTGSSRTAFFNWLYALPPSSGGTPLRSALTSAGNYFKTETPWRTDPSNSSSALLECRQNFTILMTDGYYNDSNSGGEHDNSNGVTITGPKKTYQYIAKSPFAFSSSNTLADIAMNFWKNELDAGWSSSKKLDNTVPSSTFNPAFWQHMVTFGVGFGVTGSIDPATAFSAIGTNATINWPSTSTNPGKIDDLLHAAVNSRGGFFTASDPVAFAKGLAETLNAIVERVGTASNIAATAINSLQSESNLYQARYVAGEWSGDLWSYDVADITTPVWKANDKLPSAAARKIYYGADNNTTKTFLWSNMSVAERLALGNDSTIVDYLRGSSTLEKKNSGGYYRNRAKVLGDMVNSSPELVAEPYDLGYHRYNWSGADSYRTFINGAAKTRPQMIYVGGNDGMIHGFNATTGVETFAYIPKPVMSIIPGDTVNLLKKYATSPYSHLFSVDGSPVVADVYLNGNWKSILITGMGRGGNGMVAIDVTDPNALAASKVMWDKTYTELGVYLGKPQITRTESGKWAMIVGYGYNNITNKSGILVIDIETGNVLKSLATSKGTALDPNGTAEVNLLDVDGDGNTDWVYAADMHGYVWKFDLSSSSESSWALAYSGAPLFQAKDNSGKRQMITGGVLSSIEPKSGTVWLFFGTGRYLNQDDPSNNDTQSWYGIQDGSTISARSELDARVITNVGTTNRTVSEAAVLTPGKKGWYMDLPDTRERIVDVPLLVGGELLMNTVIPDTNVCNPSGSGYIMAVSPYTGSRLKKTFFDLDKDSTFDSSDMVIVSGTPTVVSAIKVSSLNSVTTLAKVGNKIESFNNCEGGCVESRTIDPTKNAGMQSWREISN